MSQRDNPAPPIDASRWLNTPKPLDLPRLQGRVVVIEAFQMLCPGCVSHGLPQAMRVREMFRETDVAVMGLHSVFEHHEAQTPTALAAFLHEYRITFPVAVDSPGASGGLPKTMAAYGMEGTPTLILIDRMGCRRAQHFGHVHDLKLRAEIMALVLEGGETTRLNAAERERRVVACDDAVCPTEPGEGRRPA